MPERIIGQCSTTDFKAIEHQVDVYGTPAFDPTSLKRKQVLALALVAGFSAAGLSFEDCYRIREVLFWEHHMVFRFFPGLEADRLKLKLHEKADVIQSTMAAVLKGGRAV